MNALKMKKVEDEHALDKEQLQVVVEQNPRQSMRQMSQTLGISTATVSCHLQSIEKIKKTQ